MISQSIRSQDERVVITWKELSFQTLVKDPANSKPFNPVYKCKTVLDNLSGHAESKELLAIMGPTGCGKTSLLNVLAARFPTNGSAMSRLTGQIFVNGKPRNENNFRKISAYVLQDDFMYAFLTVFETLMLSAHFFLPTSLSDEDKINIVNATISELGLVKAKDTIIGNDKIRGVSGGERRRASIAVQMLTDPAVLFLDEPTSGLDAFQSLAVMEAMKNLANNGRLVISVIHQPRSSIYEMFDKILLLSEGKTMYYGKAVDAVQYFSKFGYTCPDDFNPADFFLDLLSPDNRSQENEEETKNRISHLGDSWLAHSDNFHSQNFLSLEEFKSIKSIGNTSDIYKTFRNFTLLCWRCWNEQARNKVANMIKFVTALFFALIIGGIYSNIGNSQKSIQNREGVLYFILINQAFTSVSAVMNSFPKEKLIVSRERSGQAYNTFSYCLAKLFVEMPLNLFPILIYSCIVHGLVGLNKHNFGFFILITLLANFTAITLGLCISCIAPTVEAANALSPPFLIIGILFGGFYIKVKSLPIVLDWIPYISLFRWGFEALCINEFKGLHFTCDTDPDQCFLTGEEVLSSLDFDHHMTEYAVFGLGMLMLCYVAGLYILLELNNIHYLSLGSIGNKFEKLYSKSKSSNLPEKSYELLNPTPEEVEVQESTNIQNIETIEENKE